MIASLRAPACALSLLLAGQSLGAQQRELIGGTVRTGAGNPLADVRVQATGAAVDTVVRTDARGTFSVLLPLGTIRVRATMIGYEPAETEVNITSADVRIALTLRALPPQLAAVEARANWVGIRGVVGDESTMMPLPGVTIRSISRDVHVVTDSAGRFSFPLPKSERTTMRLEREGYRTRPAVVLMQGPSADVVLLMTPGEDPNHLPSALADLSSRMGWGGIGMFVLDQEQMMQRTGNTTLWDGIRNSGMLHQKGILLTHICMFVNGMPRPFLHPRMITLAEVDFVEVWGYNREDTRTFSSRWTGGSCAGGRSPGRRGDGPWISVWLR